MPSGYLDEKKLGISLRGGKALLSTELILLKEELVKESLWGGIDGAQLGPSKLDDPFFKKNYVCIWLC